jgi:hypothetical protein
MKEIELPVRFFVTTIAMAMMIAPIMWFMWGSCACERRGGFQRKYYGDYVGRFLQEITSGFIC